MSHGKTNHFDGEHCKHVAEHVNNQLNKPKEVELPRDRGSDSIYGFLWFVIGIALLAAIAKIVSY